MWGEFSFSKMALSDVLLLNNINFWESLEILLRVTSFKGKIMIKEIEYDRCNYTAVNSYSICIWYIIYYNICM